MIRYNIKQLQELMSDLAFNIEALNDIARHTEDLPFERQQKLITHFQMMNSELELARLALIRSKFNMKVV